MLESQADRRRCCEQECAGEMLVNQVYAFNVNRMNELFFRRESNLFNEYFKGRNFSNVVIGSWRRKEDQNIEREIEYTIPASSLVKANRAKEVHTYLVFEPSAYTVKVSWQRTLEQLAICWPQLSWGWLNLRDGVILVGRAGSSVYTGSTIWKIICHRNSLCDGCLK